MKAGVQKLNDRKRAVAGGLRLMTRVSQRFKNRPPLAQADRAGQFNAHTYDRSHYVYSNESNKEYYILW